MPFQQKQYLFFVAIALFCEKREDIGITGFGN
jgi:hypothetical protein